MNVQTDHTDGLMCIRITMTYDEARALKYLPQKSWLWKRFWSLLKCFV